MTAKQFLSQVMYTDKRIDIKLEQLAKLRDTATKATAAVSKMPRSDTPNLQAMEGIIVKIVDLGREINRDIDQLIDLKCEVQQAINKLPNPRQKMILELRYLCYKTWPEIIAEMRYSESSVYRLHGTALKNIAVPEKLGVNAIVWGS